MIWLIIGGVVLSPILFLFIKTLCQDPLLLSSFLIALLLLGGGSAVLYGLCEIGVIH